MVIGGAEINDNRACCPISKRLFAESIDTPRGDGLQSRTTCSPLPMIRSIRKLRNCSWEKSPFAFEIYTGVSNTEGFGVAMVILVLLNLVYSPFVCLVHFSPQINNGWRQFNYREYVHSRVFDLSQF
jgi:hypothetical protein